TKPQEISPRSKSAITWEDIAGVDETKDDLREVVEFLRHPRQFKALSATVPKGILLHGPPGTGKTLLAKAVAHESGAQFFSQSASSFVEVLAGLGAARIRRLFKEARDHAPAVIFIADLDAVAGLQSRKVITDHEKRVVAWHEAGHALVSELLPSVDKVQKVSIVPRGKALGYTLNLPQEDRYLKSREELIDFMKVLLAGRVS